MDQLSDLLRKAAKPQGTATAPQETATAPQGTATPPQGTATPLQGTATAPTGGGGAYSGGQADLIVQNDKILKLYKKGCCFNAAVLSLVKGLKGKGYVVDLYDFGTMDHEGEQRPFELMAYCPEGAVSAVDLKGDKDSILKIVRKVAKALDACHRAGFIHKDVKPANILIRDRSTWDCVLCDFGIADELDHGKVTTQQSRTPVYAAPEVYEHTITIENKTYCELTPAADFYSLGMTILCLWIGESALHRKETVLAMQKVNNGIVVPTDMPEPLYTITRGLLIKDPAHRWGLKEINDCLDGKHVDLYDEHRQGGLNIIFNSSKHQIAHSPEELAAFMVDDTNLAIKYLYSGKVSKWLEHIPELQIEIENIVEKEFPNNQKMGLLAAIHTLNPFYDLNLCCDLHDPDYAMTGETIGKVLNRAYDRYFTQNDADTLDTCIAESFRDADSLDYVPWFLDHKGKRFAQQRKWYNYCVFGDHSKNSKKAGPKDPSYLHQVAMMKTIAGFGATPEYRLSRTGQVLSSIDDLHNAPKKELLYDLQNDKGLRGWLAVLYQENPHAELSKQYSYEKLLEQYVEAIGAIDASNPIYKRFHKAQEEARGLVTGAKNQIRGTWTSSLIQRLIAIFLGVVPLTLLLVDIILCITDNLTISIGGWSSGLFVGITVIATLIFYFAFDTDGCIVAIIAGLIVAAVITFILSLISAIILYIYGIVVLGVIIFFGITTLFDVSGKRKRVKNISNPGFEELTLEPLYYAFSQETKFDSSLNGEASIQSTNSWKQQVKKRWKNVIILAASTLVLMLFRLALPKSERMDRFDRFLKNPFNTETVQYDEVQPLSDPEP